MMSSKFLAQASVMSLALILAGCGGDDSSSPLAGNGDGQSSTDGGDDGGSGTDGAPNQGPAVGSILLVGNPTQIATSNSSTSEITARVRSSSGVLLEGVDVSFGIPSSNGTLQVPQSVTDESGSATALASSFGNAQNRSMTVSASAGGIEESITIDVSGTTIAFSGPASIASGNTAQFTARLQDADSNGVAGEDLVISSSNNNPVEASTLTTDSSGAVNFSVEAANAGTDTISVSAFNDSNQVVAERQFNVSPDSFQLISPTANTEIDIGTLQSVEVEWLNNGNPIADGSTINFASTRGSVSSSSATTSGGTATINIQSEDAGPAIISATDPSTGLTTQTEVEFVAITPDSVSLNATPVQIGIGETSQITATVRDPSGNPVKNKQVNFSLDSDSTNGSISATGTSNSQGQATATFTAGSGVSGDGGVIIRATVNGSITGSVDLTVSKQSLRITLGTGNEIEEPDTVSYRKPWLLLVTDANGAPVSGAEVELSILPVRYRKGQYVPTDIDNPPDGEADAWRAQVAAECNVEDQNYNGQLEPGEDVNGNGTLEPSNEVTTSSPSVTTAEDGSARFDLLYPQSQCSWVTARLSAKARVSGTERTESTSFGLTCLASDLDDLDVDPPVEGEGTESPYGSAASCADPN